EMAQQKCPNIPVVIFSEVADAEVAVEVLKQGATDFVLKQRPQRLISAVRRALVEAQEKTERLSAQEGLRNREEQFRLVLERGKGYAVFTLDLQGRITSWNSGARRLLGHEESEILGQSGRVLFTPEDQALGVPESEMAGALAKEHGDDERWQRRKDGSLFWAGGSMLLLRGAAGAIAGFLKILRDPTAQK